MHFPAKKCKVSTQRLWLSCLTGTLGEQMSVGARKQIQIIYKIHLNTLVMFMAPLELRAARHSLGGPAR